MGKAREVGVLKRKLEDQKKVTNQPPEARCVQPGAGPEKSVKKSVAGYFLCTWW